MVNIDKLINEVKSFIKIKCKFVTRNRKDKLMIEIKSIILFLVVAHRFYSKMRCNPDSCSVLDIKYLQKFRKL